MYYLSLADLLLVEGFREAFSQNDKEKINNILFQNGMDIVKKVKTRVCTHRTLSGKVAENTLRYEGSERTDRPWKDTGAASIFAWTGDDFNDDCGLKELSQEINMSEYSSKRIKREVSGWTGEFRSD